VFCGLRSPSSEGQAQQMMQARRCGKTGSLRVELVFLTLGVLLFSTVILLLVALPFFIFLLLSTILLSQLQFAIPLPGQSILSSVLALIVQEIESGSMAVCLFCSRLLEVGVTLEWV
jgi:hypothetical protein